MDRITSTEFQQNVGRYSDKAMREPVVITKRERDHLVLLSIEDYERLKSLDTRMAGHPSEMPDFLKDALEKSIEDMSDVKATNYPVEKF